MRKILSLLAVVLVLEATGQEAPVAVIDFVKIRDGKRAEALFFYENNWKVYRDIALQKGIIQSYELLTTTPDSAANFDLMLVTVYKDSTQWAMAEERFQGIIKEVRPAGPKLLNDLKPAAFRQNVFNKKTELLFYAPKQ